MIGLHGGCGSASRCAYASRMDSVLDLHHKRLFTRRLMDGVISRFRRLSGRVGVLILADVSNLKIRDGWDDWNKARAAFTVMAALFVSSFVALVLLVEIFSLSVLDPQMRI